MYSFVRPIAAFALKIFFRKIYFTNRDRLPKGKPLILAINHPTAFIEPCICACFLPMKLYFLVRGDLFKKPFYRKILNVLHMVPIYRMAEDGYGQMKKNDDTFRFCFEALNDRKTVVILPEGSTVQEKRLRPIKKGLARIAFGTYEKYGDIDLHVVAIGVNYTEPDKFRSVAMFDVAEPIPLRDYYDYHAENPKKSIRLLTAKVKEDLENLIVSIPEKKDEDLTESFFSFYHNNQKANVLPIIEENRKPLTDEMNIAKAVHKMSEEEKKSWAGRLEEYETLLKEKGVSDVGLQQPDFYNWKNTLFLILGFIPYFFGYWLNYPIFGYAKHVSQTRVKRQEFKAPVALAIGLGLSIIVVFFLVSVGVMLWGWWSILILVGLFYLGRFSLIYLELWEKWKAGRAVSKISSEEKLALEKEREVITLKVDEFVS